MNTTLVKQLAYYVTTYSSLQMAANIPGNYERFPNAFQFIKDVAVDWDNIYIIEAEPRDVIIARKAKGKDEWFVSGITDQNQRTTTMSFDYLPKGKKYVVTIYADSKDANWNKKPQQYTINKVVVTSKTVLKQYLAPGGGVAINIKEGSTLEIRRLKKLQ